MAFHIPARMGFDWLSGGIGKGLLVDASGVKLPKSGGLKALRVERELNVVAQPFFLHYIQTRDISRISSLQPMCELTNENDLTTGCPHCHATVSVESICEAIWEACQTDSQGMYSCCGQPIQHQSIHEAIRLITRNPQGEDQVMDLNPPHDGLQINVSGAYRTVLDANLPLNRVKTEMARRLYRTEFYGLPGGGPTLPILLGIFDNTHVLIDGMHRINYAANSGIKYIPCFILTADQTNAITEPRCL